MSEPRRVDLETVAAQRWKNGAGLTREIAVAPADAGIDEFDWRLSVAELERDAPFSAFPGVDRCIVVLAGSGMQMLDAHGTPVQALRPLEPWSFEGERALQARLPEGPCRDFNVMTRRGRWRAELDLHRRGQTIETGDAMLLLAVQGRWRTGAHRLDPMQGLLWQTRFEGLAIEPLDADAVLLQVRLCHDCRP